MFSLSYLYQALGDNEFADRCELAAFNALPVHLTPDWWAHTYGTQPNGPNARHVDHYPFWNMMGYALTYGLEPNYPCCTVNHIQGYPKFLAASFVRVGSNGIAHTLLGPGSVSLTLSSGPIIVNCSTNYPFDETLTYTISSSAPFTFYVRIPNWANTSASALNTASSRTSLSPDSHTGLQPIPINGETSKFNITLASNNIIRTQPLANNSIAVYSGAILYALEIGASVSSHAPLTSQQTPYPPQYLIPEARDYVMMNATPWNIAIDPNTLSFHSNLSSSSTLANPLWAPGAPPTWMTALGCEISWPLCGDVPCAVPPQVGRTCLGAVMNVTLRPYGSQKLHMSVLPTINLSGHT